MKTILLFACLTLLMTSCSVKTYYQVVDVKSTNLEKRSNNYVYNDGVCQIVYNFWSNGGDAGFSIGNLSDDVIYVDLGNSFYIENGLAKDYSSTKIVAELNSNVASVEKTAVAIPPHASKRISEYKVMEDVLQNCSVRLKVKKNQPEGTTFTESESPIIFKNYITYRKKGNEAAKVISNDFYVSGFTNYLSKDILKTRRAGCKKGVIKTVFDKYAPDRFYVKYNEMSARDYSADAKGIASSKAKKGSSNGAQYSARKQ